MKVEESMEDYMRMALEISADDLQEFIMIMKGNRAKYYFALDGILLIAIMMSEQANSEYLAELIELCDISKEDLKFISLVAKSVLYQDSTYFDVAKKLLNDNVKELNFLPYIENYYAGAVVDTLSKKTFYAPKNFTECKITYPVLYEEEEVCFQNLDIEVTTKWKFRGCRKVTFKNCKIKSTGGFFNFNSVGNIRFEECQFYDFKNRVGYIKSVNDFALVNCRYWKCGYISKKGGERGGVFYIENEVEINSILLKNNTLLNCYIESLATYVGATAVFLGLNVNIISKFIVVDNTFNGCKCIRPRNLTEALIGGYYTVTKLVNNQNTCSGELVRLFEKEK